MANTYFSILNQFIEFINKHKFENKILSEIIETIYKFENHYE